MQFTITIPENDLGQPRFDNAPIAKLRVRIDTDNDKTDIVISGKGGALRRFAEVVLGVSNTPDYHEHLDDIEPVQWFPRNISLTIENDDKRPPSDRKRPAAELRDWVKG